MFNRLEKESLTRKITTDTVEGVITPMLGHTLREIVKSADEDACLKTIKQYHEAGLFFSLKEYIDNVFPQVLSVSSLLSLRRIINGDVRMENDALPSYQQYIAKIKTNKPSANVAWSDRPGLNEFDAPYSNDMLSVEQWCKKYSKR